MKAARALAGGRLSRASVIFPDVWARTLPVELETLPDDSDAGREMVLWKLSKLLPGHPTDLAIVIRADARAHRREARPRRGRVARHVESIERAFEEAGVKVGYLAPAGLAIFEGLARTLSRAASGDYALLHRIERRPVVLHRARRGADLLPPAALGGARGSGQDTQDREARLSLSYYAERLKGPGLSAVYVHDELPGRELEKTTAFPVSVVPLSSRLFRRRRARQTFDERLAARPELLSGFAAVFGGR